MLAEKYQVTTSMPKNGYDWRKEPVGLYLHVPFCESKCIYCDFNSYAGMEHKFEPFVRALVRDIERGASWDLPGTPSCEGAEITTIFFGGGTPSVLTPGQIGRILEAAKRRYHIAPGAEVTMEANPGTISLEKFEGYLAAGVNRLSMGVQVLDDRMLKKLGRIHTAEGALESYRLARQAGFDNINLDFIYGLPGQDLPHLESVMDRLLDVDPLPDHLSCYSLIVEENTPLYTGVERGLISVPEQDAVADMYEHICARLPQSGYTQYEISNWSRGKPCAHNLVYWHDGRYLAFGPGASGYWGDMRYTALLSPGEYIRNVVQGGSVISERTPVSREDEMSEVMMLGLRLNEGISLDYFEARFGVPLAEVYGQVVAEVTGLGLLEEVDGWLRLTERGRLLGNEVFARFI
ncbi:MAG: radical SAM family heme chaperone HemW [Chloroflexota bacterium]|nr:radical SAM family heme chaperone HemW [Chloroflexota bacterium]MDQ5865311.1 radical SAM family heme chaperone HemW [Chloroflexota bacterium]